MAKKLFTPDELKRIKEAVETAEAQTNGEIVPVFAKQADFYEVALWRAGAVFCLLAVIVLLAIDFTTNWLHWTPIYFWLLTIAAAGFIGAWLTVSIDGLKRLFCGKSLLHEMALRKAELQFLEYGIVNTEQRIGIMIFVSFFEHQVVVLADDGINAVIQEDQWSDVVAHLTAKLREGKKTEAIVDAIHECAALVMASPIEIEPSENEIDDELRIEE